MEHGWRNTATAVYQTTTSQKRNYEEIITKDLLLLDISDWFQLNSAQKRLLTNWKKVQSSKNILKSQKKFPILVGWAQYISLGICQVQVSHFVTKLDILRANFVPLGLSMIEE